MVHNCTGVTPFYATKTVEADVTINGDLMTGTLIGVYSKYLSDGTLNHQHTLRVTFEASRVVE